MFWILWIYISIWYSNQYTYRVFFRIQNESIIKYLWIHWENWYCGERELINRKLISWKSQWFHDILERILKSYLSLAKKYTVATIILSFPNESVKKIIIKKRKYTYIRTSTERTFSFYIYVLHNTYIYARSYRENLYNTGLQIILWVIGLAYLIPNVPSKNNP